MNLTHSIAVALQRLVRRLSPPRKVWLEKFDGSLVVAKARYTESGWAARWIGNDDQWSLLREGGDVLGTDLVTRWMPHTGWGVPPNAGGLCDGAAKGTNEH